MSECLLLVSHVLLTGMTLQGLARVAGGEILENGGELGGVGNSSPAMSPNLPPAHSLHAETHYSSTEDRYVMS